MWGTSPTFGVRPAWLAAGINVGGGRTGVNPTRVEDQRRARRSTRRSASRAGRAARRERRVASRQRRPRVRRRSCLVQLPSNNGERPDAAAAGAFTAARASRGSPTRTPPRLESARADDDPELPADVAAAMREEAPLMT